MAQVVRFLPPTWEIRMEFLASGCGMYQPCYWHLESEPAGGKSFWVSLVNGRHPTGLTSQLILAGQALGSEPVNGGSSHSHPNPHLFPFFASLSFKKKA